MINAKIRKQNKQLHLNTLIRSKVLSKTAEVLASFVCDLSANEGQDFLASGSLELTMFRNFLF